MFFDKKFWKSSEFYYSEPGFYPSKTNNVESVNTLTEERSTTAEAVSHLEDLEELKKLTSTLQMKNLVLDSLKRNWDTVLELMLAMNLMWCLEGKGVTKQNLDNTLSTYTLSWYTRTWLITKLLVPRNFQCCVVFFLTRSSKLETL